MDRPALTRTTISTPRLLKPFAAANHAKPSHEQVRPYNFLLVAHAAPLAHPPGTIPERFLLVAPYENDPRRWRRLAWTNAYEPGSRYRITTSGRGAEQTVRVQTYRDVLARYRTHPEHKSLAPDGAPCDRQTRGLLRRRPVSAATITYIGKEANRLEDAHAGLIGDLDDVLNHYPDPARDPFDQLARPVLRTLPVKQAAAATGLGERTIKQARAAGNVDPATRAKLTEHAACHARQQLQAAGIKPPHDDHAALAAYHDHHKDATGPHDRRPFADLVIEHARTLIAQAPTCPGCGRPIIKPGRRGPRPKWHSDRCRKRARRGLGLVDRAITSPDGR